MCSWLQHWLLQSLRVLIARHMQVFVYACAHADQIKQYIKDSKWTSQRGVEVKVRHITTEVPDYAVTASGCQQQSDGMLQRVCSSVLAVSML